MTEPERTEPRILSAGDRYIIVEFARSNSLRMNMYALELARRIDEEDRDGILELLPMFVSLLVHYDSSRISREALEDMCGSLLRDIEVLDDLEHRSPLIEIPVCYGDPWTRACVEDYARRIAPIEDNPTYVAAANGLRDVEHLFALHSATEHWVGGVGFWPGLPDMMPLDPRSRLSVPKYDPPRIWTVTGAIGVGGGFTSIYPMRTPGGYHLIGRTPVPIYDLQRRSGPAFRDSVVLFRPGDRVRFRRIEIDEFEHIEASVAAGTFALEIAAERTFSLGEYESWLADQEASLVGNRQRD
jgi:urea carboxylase